MKDKIVYIRVYPNICVDSVVVYVPLRVWNHKSLPVSVKQAIEVAVGKLSSLEVVLEVVDE